MWWEIKLNSKKLRQIIDEELRMLNEGYLLDDLAAVTLGRAYMYLGEYEKGKEYILKCIEEEREFEKKVMEEYGYESEQVAMCKVRIGKHMRWIGEIEKMEDEFKEAIEIFNKVYEEGKREKLKLVLYPWGSSDFYILWATAEFYLGNYEKAVEIKKLMEGRHGILPSGFAESILKRDVEGIKTLIKRLVELIKDEKRPLHSDVNKHDPWHWYEEGKKLIGLPSIFDVYDKRGPMFECNRE